MARAATLPVAVAIWFVGAVLLWRTKVPGGLHLPSLDERAIFGASVVRRAEHFDRFFYVEWLLSTVASIAVLVWMARRGPRVAASLRLGRVNTGIVLGAVTLTAVWAVSVPFQVASNWWQRRYGISTQSYESVLSASWGTMLGTVLFGFLLLAFFLGLAQKLGGRWWLVAAPALVAISAVVQLVIPYALTNGSHALHDRRLAAEIRQLERLEGAGRPKVLVQTMSDQTTAANAYSVGYGPSRRIVFWDTLLDGRFGTREVRFVAAHELAHLARDHILKAIGWFTLFAVPILGAAAYVTERRGGLRNPATVPLALLVIILAQLAARPLESAISRRYEAEADWVALNATRDPVAARGLFKRFATTSLEDPAPPWWAHVLLDDHPTVLTRIEQAAAWKRLNP
ncbi:MAG TPA: M48 family metalloprotease [Gaiellaceae bacterium]